MSDPAKAGEREPANEILSERSESKDLLIEPFCGRERSREAGEREPAGEIPSASEGSVQAQICMLKP